MKKTAMWPFSDNSKHEIKHIHHRVESSFSNVKSDVYNIFSWIRYLQQSNEFLKSQAQNTNNQLHHISQKLDDFNISKSDIKHMIDEHYQHHQKDHFAQFDHITQKLDNLSRINQEKASDIFQRLEMVAKRVESLESAPLQKRRSFKEKIVQKIQKSSKDYVKGIILNFIRKYERISALKLREIVVEEQGLSSKSSFYRILEEIEEQEDIAIVREGKEKIYILKMATN